MDTYRSNGKLLISGEYVVLDGAVSLAVPTKYGQSLRVDYNNESNSIHWESYDENNELWFSENIEIEDIINNNPISENPIAIRLIEILNKVNTLNPSFFLKLGGCNIKTQLDFNKDWGLGTSSTLISNISKWANIDPYKLLEQTFGGSGYDIACATTNKPITYKVLSNVRNVKTIDFSPSFKDHLYFVYLNKKQNSRQGISIYKKQRPINSRVISEITDITHQMSSCNDLINFNALIDKHEEIISKTIKQDTVKQRLFKDFKGSIKSLGAWGGDFILVSSSKNPTSYFTAKGYNTIIPYSKMVL